MSGLLDSNSWCRCRFDSVTIDTTAHRLRSRRGDARLEAVAEERRLVIATGEYEDMGNITTLADPAVVETLIKGHKEMVEGN